MCQKCDEIVVKLAQATKESIQGARDAFLDFSNDPSEANAEKTVTRLMDALQARITSDAMDAAVQLHHEAQALEMDLPGAPKETSH